MEVVLFDQSADVAFSVIVSWAVVVFDESYVLLLVRTPSFWVYKGMTNAGA
jgi:hypothetical protein